MKFIIKIVLVFFPVLLFSQEVSFTATSDIENRIVVGEYFKVKYTLTNASFDRFTPPKFQGFNQVGSPSQSSYSSSFNGRRTSNTSYTYSVLAKKKGRYILGPATAIVNGKEMKSNSLTVEVVERKGGTTESKNAEDKFFIKRTPSTAIARIGEQIQLNYKLFSQLDTRYDLGQDFDYDGFYAREMRRYGFEIGREEKDGEMYMTKTIRQVALFPQRAGLLIIPSKEIQIGVDDYSSGRRRRVYYPLVIDSLHINVLPFEEDSIPKNFSGAVGQFRMNANVDKKSLTTDQSLTITMSVQGTGDIKRVEAPDLNLGKNFDVYEPSVLDEKIYEDRGKLVGRKVFEYQIIPLKPGNYSIQPMFTYYDTDSLNFRTLAIRAVNVEVKKGNKNFKSEITQKEEKPTLVLLPNKEKTTLSQKGKFFFGSPFFWVLMILPFLALIGALVFRQQQLKKGNVDFTILKSQRAQKVAVQKLAQAEKYMQTDDSRNFYDEISKASFGYAGDKLNLPLSELSKTNIAEKLNSLNVSKNHIDDFVEIIKTCEMALFAGMDNSASMQATYSKTKDVIVKIEEELT